MFRWVIGGLLCCLLCACAKGNYEQCILECESKNDVHKYDEHPVEKCKTKEFLDDIRGGSKGCSNGPVETVVKLKADSPDIVYTPSSVHVKRCRGSCRGGLACKPSEKTMKKVSVQKRENDKFSCGMVEVEEHTSCGCDCATKECNDKQKFEDCDCKCQNEDEIPECIKSGNHEWNPNDCECKCSSTDECDTMRMWDPKNCECVLKEDNEAKR